MRTRALTVLVAASLLVSGCAKKKRLPGPPAPPLGHVETGTASWYGYPYHGRPTASGEIYDMEKFTAAHRTLPFQTWARVENLTNHRTVDVRINDRGPFVKGRIIDLSRAAARDIGMLGPGTAKVRLRTVAAPATEARRESYAVQIAAFADRERADRLRQEMERKHGAAQLVPKQGQPVLWRVLVGQEPTPEAASALAVRLSGEFEGAFVVRLDAP